MGAHSSPQFLGMDDLIRQLDSPKFDPVQMVNAAVDGKSVKEQHPASVELVAKLNTQSQALAAELEASLSTLLRSEKRVPHEIALLRNDVGGVGAALNEHGESIVSLALESRRTAVLKQLDELNEVRTRLDEVRQLLELASQPPAKCSPEEMQRLQVVFAGTLDEAKWKPRYYGLMNKII